MQFHYYWSLSCCEKFLMTYITNRIYISLLFNHPACIPSSTLIRLCNTLIYYSMSGWFYFWLEQSINFQFYLENHASQVRITELKQTMYMYKTYFATNTVSYGLFICIHVVLKFGRTLR